MIWTDKKGVRHSDYHVSCVTAWIVNITKQWEI